MASRVCNHPIATLSRSMRKWETPPCSEDDIRRHPYALQLPPDQFAAQLRSLSDAIARNVNDGDRIAMEGFTHLIPFAAAHETIRQGRKRLTLIRMTPDLIYDQLIGVGAAKRAWPRSS